MQGCRLLPAARQERNTGKCPELGLRRLAVMYASLGNLLERPGLLQLSQLSVGGFNRRCRRPSHRSSTRFIRARSKLLSVSASAMRNSASNSGNSSGAALASAARIAGPFRGRRASSGIQKFGLVGCAVRVGSPVVGVQLGACFQRDVAVVVDAVWPIHIETRCLIGVAELNIGTE